MKYIFASVLVFILAVAVQCSCPGCPDDLTDDDLKSEDLQNLAKSGIDKIYKDKLAANSLPDCIELDGDLKSGTKQVVAGMKYKLDVEVKPVQSKTGNCAAANVDLNAVATEICKIEIWVKPYQNIPEDERTEITYKCE